VRKAIRYPVIIVAAVVAALVLAILPFVLFTPRAPKPPAQLDSAAKLDTYLAALTDHGTPPAIDIVVMKDGNVAYSKAFGFADGPSRRPAVPGDVYHYWSVTKLFTATAVMQLVEDGRLRLDDPIAKHLPWFMTTVKSGAPADITVRQLLNHTSGMKNLPPAHLIGWIHHLEDRPVNQTALVRERMHSYLSLATPPGAIGAYSNAGYIVLSALVEKASGQSYEDFVRARILQPLGMTSADFLYRGDMLPRAVTGTHPFFHFFTPLLPMLHHDWFTRWVGTTRKSRMWLVPFYTDYTGPTGLLGTAGDLARFGQAFLSGGQLEGRRILRNETASMMLDEGYGGNTGPDKDRMGLGWHWWNDAPIPFKGHGGDGPGFGAQLAVFPAQNMVVVVLANDMLIDRIGLTKLVAGVFSRQ
jgi:CubicO group peptidase (beta-lactamase class C family)